MTSQHYVPRFVLRRFAAASKDTVHVYDKRTAKIFVAGTGKVAAENGLYDFEFDGEELTLEPGLAEIEGRAARHIQQILEDERLHLLNPLERGELARFFAVQFVRTPAHREMWRELDTRMEAWLRQEGMRKDFVAVDPRLGSRENAERCFIARSLNKRASKLRTSVHSEGLGPDADRCPQPIPYRCRLKPVFPGSFNTSATTIHFG